MRLNHIHLGVRDLPSALSWLEKVWEVRPAFKNDRMATVSFGSFILILDAAEEDSPATVGFESQECDADFHRVVERGGVALEEPRNRPWGARAAYIKGPGALKFEIEGEIR